MKKRPITNDQVRKLGASIDSDLTVSSPVKSVIQTATLKGRMPQANPPTLLSSVDLKLRLGFDMRI